MKPNASANSIIGKLMHEGKGLECPIKLGFIMLSRSGTRLNRNLSSAGPAPAAELLWHINIIGASGLPALTPRSAKHVVLQALGRAWGPEVTGVRLGQADQPVTLTTQGL